MSDAFAPVAGLREVPRANASALLATAAPGLLVTNEGGEGHAEGYVLRGFVADEGTGLELLVDGVPINEPGNPHAEGLADTHFVIPELVRAVRMLEGPFDPHQGNYAVAGTAEYVLGLERPTFSLSYGAGTYGTQRVLALFRPEGGEAGTFGGLELRTTDGFGANRAAKRATAMAGYELRLSRTLGVRTLATAYATSYESAGYLRADDLRAGRVGFFDTYDRTQGGDASRESISVTVEDRTPLRLLRQLVFLARRDERILDDTTGFAGDARGDATEQSYGATTVGGRGSARYALPGAARLAALEVGYHARFDATDASQRRLRFGTEEPYAIDHQAGSSLGNLSFYVDAELRPLPYVTLRGGARLDYFAWNVATRCAGADLEFGPSCGAGTRRSADGLFPEPRGTLAVGPFEGLTFAASAGIGTRTADPSSLAAASGVTVARVSALDAGVVFERAFGDFHLDARVLYYFTFVSHDALFDPEAGRVVSTASTSRQGFTAASRLRSSFLDASASLTYADAHFGGDGDPALFADPSGRVPYVPSWVGHLEVGGRHELFGWRIQEHALTGRVAVGMTGVSTRPLPGGESSDAYAVLDASLGVQCAGVEVGISAANLLDARYRLVELPYASNFVSPTAMAGDPVRHFVAGAPLTVMATLTVHLDSAAWAADPPRP